MDTKHTLEDINERESKRQKSLDDHLENKGEKIQDPKSSQNATSNSELSVGSAAQASSEVQHEETKSPEKTPKKSSDENKPEETPGGNTSTQKQTVLSFDDIADLDVAHLRKLCTKLKVNKNGRKDILQSRIRQVFVDAKTQQITLEDDEEVDDSILNQTGSTEHHAIFRDGYEHFSLVKPEMTDEDKNKTERLMMRLQRSRGFAYFVPSSFKEPGYLDQTKNFVFFSMAIKFSEEGEIDLLQSISSGQYIDLHPSTVSFEKGNGHRKRRQNSKYEHINCVVVAVCLKVRDGTSAVQSWNLHLLVAPAATIKSKNDAAVMSATCDTIDYTHLMEKAEHKPHLLMSHLPAKFKYKLPGLLFLHDEKQRNIQFVSSEALRAAEAKLDDANKVITLKQEKIGQLECDKEKLRIKQEGVRKENTKSNKAKSSKLSDENHKLQKQILALQQDKSNLLVELSELQKFKQKEVEKQAEKKGEELGQQRQWELERQSLLKTNAELVDKISALKHDVKNAESEWKDRYLQLTEKLLEKKI